MELSPSSEAASCQLLKNFPAFFFLELESSLSCSQEPSTGPYPDPDQSSPYHPILGTILILSTHRTGLPSGLFPAGFPTNIIIAFRATCPVNLILLDLIILIILGEEYEAPHSAVFSNLLSLHFSSVQNAIIIIIIIIISSSSSSSSSSIS
jgi:hypothetical protein